MGAGSLREAGEERAGGGISIGGGSREKWEKFRNIGTIFRNRKSTQRRELPRKGVGTGSAGCRRREVQTLLHRGQTSLGRFLFYFTRFHSQCSENMSKGLCNTC